MLITELQDSDVVTMRDDHFVILLPEIEKEAASKVAEKLIKVARDDLSLTLKMGMATFPDEEVTFEGLLARAEEQMKRQLAE
jgi:GGDEF domain-containing protein